MPDAATQEWTQVDLIGHRSATGQRWLAAVVAVAGIAGIGPSLLLLPDWLAVGALVICCVFLALVGVSLWFTASRGEEEGVRMLASGRRVDLPVRWILDTTDDAVSYRLGLRLPIAADEPVIVEHWCGDQRCVDAAREFPGSALPAMVDESRRAWGVVHGPIDR